MRRNGGSPLTSPDWLSEIPDEFLNDFMVITRGLYRAKPGVMVCLFRNHKASERRNTTFAQVPWPGLADKIQRMFVMTYILKGSGAVFHHGRKFQCRPGDFFQLNGGAIAEYRVSSVANLIECAVCTDRFTGDALAEQGIWDTRIEHGHVGCQPLIARAYLELFDALRNFSLDGGTLLRKFATMLDVVYTMNKAESPDMRFIQQAKLILAENSGPHLSTNDIAQAFHMSYSLFARKFRNLAGVSPVAFKLRVRMERACELLPKHSVKEVAARLGYGDPFTFSRQFKQHFKVAPSEFRAHFDSVVPVAKS